MKNHKNSVASWRMHADKLRLKSGRKTQKSEGMNISQPFGNTINSNQKNGKDFCLNYTLIQS
jgi:nucleosome binding factor SPN SPT16 subunit